LGKYKIAALSWMFRNGKINWNRLLIASVKLILKQHGITERVLLADFSSRRRSIDIQNK